MQSDAPCFSEVHIIRNSQLQGQSISIAPLAVEAIKDRHTDRQADSQTEKRKQFFFNLALEVLGYF